MNRDRTVLAAVLVVAVAAAVTGAVIGEFPDLHVYRYGGRSVLDQLPGYESDDPVTGYPLTYPPFAALVMVPLALLPGWLAAGLWTGLSAGCLAGAVVLVCRELGHPAPAWLVVAAAAGSLALEPVWQNFSFGQINLIIMLMVLVDMARPDRRTSGLLLGIAAGLKLTPLVFVVLLATVGHRGAAARASLTFVGTVLVGLTVMPGASSYWTDGLLDPKRVGPPQLAHNQSLAGALTRLLGEPPPTAFWLAVAGPISLAIVLVGVGWWRRGDRGLGICLGAMAMLLASPVAWSHHWVWAVPVALVLWERLRWAAIVWVAVFVARLILWPPWGERREFDWRWFEHLYGNAYLLAALALCVGAGIALAKARTEPLTNPDRV
jgi:alpha-1,2-mannosyltransferase